MRSDARELALEIALLAAFFLLLSFPLLGVFLSFYIVAVEFSSNITLTEAQKAFFQPRQYYLVFLSLAVSMTTLVFIACAVRFLIRRPPQD